MRDPRICLLAVSLEDPPSDRSLSSETDKSTESAPDVVDLTVAQPGDAALSPPIAETLTLEGANIALMTTENDGTDRSPRTDRIPTCLPIAIDSSVLNNLPKEVFSVSAHSDFPVQQQDGDAQRNPTDEADSFLLDLDHAQKTGGSAQSPPNTQQKEKMLAESDKNESFRLETSDDTTLPHADLRSHRSLLHLTSLMTSTGEKEGEKEGEEREPTAGRTKLCQPLSGQHLTGQSLRTAKRNIQRAFSMPIPENSIFYQIPANNTGPSSMRKQIPRPDIAPLSSLVKENSRPVRSQPSAVPDQISPLDTAKRTSPRFSKFGHTWDDSTGYANSPESGNRAQGKNEDIQMLVCDVALNSQATSAQESEQCKGQEVSVIETRETQRVLLSLPDVSIQGWSLAKLFKPLTQRLSSRVGQRKSHGTLKLRQHC